MWRQSLIILAFVCGCHGVGVDTAQPHRHTGQTCTADDECGEGGLCPETDGERVCTTACVGTNDCLLGWRCQTQPLAGHEGVCVCNHTPGVCGDIDHNCDGLPDVCVCRTDEWTICEDGCALLASDPANCGACRAACARNETCTDGRCNCPPQSDCGSLGCVDKTTDPANCGACGHACAAWQICRDGACGCSAGGESACAGFCADLGSDREHCGGCDSVCPDGVRCHAGRCGCDAGLTECGAQCANTSTDPWNCGGCGAVCPGQTYSHNVECIDGRCWDPPVIASNLDTFAAQGGTAFFFDGTHALKRVRAPWTGAAELSGAPGAVSSMAVDASNIYWTLDGNGGTNGRVMMAPNGARWSAATTIAATQQEPRDIVVHAGVAYWTDISSGSIWYYSPASSPPQPYPLVRAGAVASGIVVDDSNVYWVHANGGSSGFSLRATALSGDPTVDIAWLGDAPTILAADAEHLYWLDQNGDPARVNKTGGPVTLLAQTSTGVESTRGALAVNTDSVYWVARGAALDDRIMRLDLGGGDPIMLRQASGAIRLVLDDTYLYCMTASSGLTALPLK